VLKLKHLINLFVLFLLIVSFNSVGLPQCSAVFPGGVANYNDGYTTLRKKVKIHDSNNGSIITKNLYISAGNGNGNKPKCDGANCVKSNTNAITSSESALIPDIVNDGSTTNLPTTLNGDYFIKLQQVYMLNDYTVTGPTRIFIESGFANLSSNLTISGKINNGGVPENLIIYVKGNLTASSGTKVSSYIYLTGYASVGAQTQITGALTSGWGIDLGNQSQVHYQSPPNELKGICSQTPASLISEYRFDATSWVNGTANQVTDSVSGFNGAAYGTQPVDGKLCNAVDLSASGISDYIDLGTQAIDGKTDFSISFWLNSNNTSGQSIFSGANSSSYYDLVMWFNSPTDFQPYIKNNPNGNISTSSIADNSWHHVVWTRSGPQNCLYRDKVLQGCVSHSSAALDINKFILGQEQSSSGLDPRYDFEGLIDEMLIFDGALSSTQITTIYDNQNSGLGHDGSARTCPIVSPVLDMRFDEASYSGTNSVLDNSGNNFHGTGTNVLPVDGLLCKAADFSSDSANDYITMNASAMNGLNDFSVVVWGKSSSSQDSTILSGARDTSTQGINESVFFFKNNNEFWPSITASPFDDNTQLGTSVSMNDNNWHQLVWTRKASTAQSCFYFDGISQGCITHPDSDDTATLQIASLILGQEQDSFQGGFDAGQDWEGLLDELTIFGSVLNGNQINTIKTNVESGKNWDGSTRSCGLTPVAEYHFDETSWDGSAGDAKDSSSNNLHLTSYNAITDNSSPIISGSPGFCRYGEFNGTNAYVQLDTDNSLISLASELSVTAWINPDTLPTGTNLKAIVSKDENYEFHLTSSGEIFWWWGGGTKELTTSGANITPDTWYHLAITYKDGQQKIYIDGVEKATSSRTGNLTLNNDSFQVGQDQGFSGRYFDGSIDEVRIFDRYLTQTDVVTIMNDTRVCSSSVDHYRLELSDNAGLTCEAESMTLKACSNSSCNTPYIGNATVDLTPNSGWLDSSNNTIANGNISFNSGQVDIKFSQTSSGTASYALTSSTPSANLSCYVGNTSVNCETAFSDTGLRFSNSDGSAPVDFQHQIAGQVLTDKVYLQPIKTNSVTGACQSVYQNKTKAIEFQLACSDPGTCQADNTGMTFTLDDRASTNKIIAKLASGNFTSVDLDFNASGVAEVKNIKYMDAGKIKLNVRAQLQSSTDHMSGSSNEFIFRPDRYQVNINDGGHILGEASYAANANHSKYRKTGEDFTVQVKALNQAGNVTLNYDDVATTASMGNVSFSPTLQAPLGGQVGSLSATSFTFDNGVSHMGGNNYVTLNWDQVGILQLDANLNALDYMGWSRADADTSDELNISGSENNIGRFVPAQFELTGQGVTPGCDDFTYMGQGFSLNYTVQAQNHNSVKMQNYVYSTIANDNFAKSTPTLYSENTDGINNQVAGNNVAGSFGARLNVSSANWALNTAPIAERGILSLTDNTANFSRLTSPDGAFIGVNLILKANDPDGSELINMDEDPETATTCSGASCSGKKINSSALDFRYGRLMLDNSYGSELENIQIPMQMEYWDSAGGSFKYNDLDSCTAYVVANVATTPIHDVEGTDGVMSLGTYALGAGLTLKASQSNLEVTIKYTVPDYLKFDWDGNVLTPDENPKASFQFGRYRRNDRVIYWREQ